MARIEARAPQAPTKAAVGVERNAFPRRPVLVAAIALSLGLAGFAAGRAHAGADAAGDDVVALHAVPAIEPVAVGRPGVEATAMAAPESAPGDEPGLWTMLAAGVLGVGVIASRRTR